MKKIWITWTILVMMVVPLFAALTLGSFLPKVSEPAQGNWRVIAIITTIGFITTTINWSRAYGKSANPRRVGSIMKVVSVARRGSKYHLVVEREDESLIYTEVPVRKNPEPRVGWFYRIVCGRGWNVEITSAK